MSYYLHTSVRMLTARTSRCPENGNDHPDKFKFLIDLADNSAKEILRVALEIIPEGKWNEELLRYAISTWKPSARKGIFKTSIVSGHSILRLTNTSTSWYSILSCPECIHCHNIAQDVSFLDCACLSCILV